MTTTNARGLWFATKSNPGLNHAIIFREGDEDGAGACAKSVKPSVEHPARLAVELPGDARFCNRCWTKTQRTASAPVVDTAESIAAPEQAPEKPRRLTASQVWNNLTLLQREQLLAWFTATYAPGANAARFQLTRNASLTHAQKIIAETWKGMEP